MANVTLKNVYKKYPGGVVAVSDFNLEIFCDCNTRTGSFWCVDCSGSHGTYDDSGNIEYCCRHKFYTEYRNYTSVYQLWWNVSCFSAFGNGACP